MPTLGQALFRLVLQMRCAAYSSVRCDRTDAGILGTSLQQMPIALTGHPPGPGEMAVISAARAVGLRTRVNVQDDPRDLAPNHVLCGPATSV
jgi:hypothetical protein